MQYVLDTYKTLAPGAKKHTWKKMFWHMLIGRNFDVDNRVYKRDMRTTIYPISGYDYQYCYGSLYPSGSFLRMIVYRATGVAEEGSWDSCSKDYLVVTVVDFPVASNNGAPFYTISVACKRHSNFGMLKYSRQSLTFNHNFCTKMLDLGDVETRPFVIYTMTATQHQGCHSWVGDLPPFVLTLRNFTYQLLEYQQVYLTSGIVLPYSYHDEDDHTLPLATMLLP